MSGGIVTHANFGGRSTLDRLRDAGVDVEASGTRTLTDDQLTEMGLPEPGYGEEMVGHCTAEEAQAYYSTWRAKKNHDDSYKKAVGEALSNMGTTIRDSDRSMRELVESGEIKMDFPDEDAARRYFETERRVAFLRESLYWIIGERLDLHYWRLGVRSKLRIIKVERRY